MTSFSYLDLKFLNNVRIQCIDEREGGIPSLCIIYIREVASNRRSIPKINISLYNISQFRTCATEEPILGFELRPSIQFIIPPENQWVIEGHNTHENSESVNVQSQSSDGQEGEQQGSVENPEVPSQVFRYVPSFPSHGSCMHASIFYRFPDQLINFLFHQLKTYTNFMIRTL